MDVADVDDHDIHLDIPAVPVDLPDSPPPPPLEYFTVNSQTSGVVYVVYVQEEESPKELFLHEPKKEHAHSVVISQRDRNDDTDEEIDSECGECNDCDEFMWDNIQEVVMNGGKGFP